MKIITPNNLRQNGKKSTKARGRKGLSVRMVDDYLRFALFLGVIGLAYIWNSHYAEKQIKELDALETSVKSLKSRYLLKQSTLSAGTRLSEVKDVVDTLGLRPLSQPAYRLIKGKTFAETKQADPEEIDRNLRRQIAEEEP
ncbi:MAG: FtsL-like putative cell division protein [Bacteroidota bacterium]